MNDLSNDKNKVFVSGQAIREASPRWYADRTRIGNKPDAITISMIRHKHRGIDSAGE